MAKDWADLVLEKLAAGDGNVTPLEEIDKITTDKGEADAKSPIEDEEQPEKDYGDEAIKESGIKVAADLLAGLGHKQCTKSAFDWSRLIPWIPGVNDIRRHGTAADVRLNPAQLAERQVATDALMKEKAPEYAKTRQQVQSARDAGTGNMLKNLLIYGGVPLGAYGLYNYMTSPAEEEEDPRWAMARQPLRRR